MRNNQYSRHLQLQKQITLHIRAEVRKLLGKQTRELKNYYSAYKREFAKNTKFKLSTRTELINILLKNKIILIGDYHTFKQSQRTALRILRDCIKNDKIPILALEMINSEHQSILDEYLDNKINEETFLNRIHFHRKWGFPWNHYKPLFDFAREYKIKVIALNKANASLNNRDKHAAGLIKQYHKKYPNNIIVTLFGDLHLARGHLPKKIIQELKLSSLSPKILIIFQNSETLYWKLVKSKILGKSDVLKLDAHRFCIMNSAPWVKLQSLLLWHESSEEAFTDDVAPSAYDYAHQTLINLTKILDIKLPEIFDFTVQTIDDLNVFIQSLIKNTELTRNEKKIIKLHIIASRALFIPKTHTLYLPSLGINTLYEGISKTLHRVLSKTNPLLTNPNQNLSSNILQNIFSYFCSKLLNPNRKCSLIRDFEINSKLKLENKSLKGERLRKFTAKSVLKMIQYNNNFFSKKRILLWYRKDIDQCVKLYKPKWKSKKEFEIYHFYEHSIEIGNYYGELLYKAFCNNQVTATDILSWMKVNLNQDTIAKRTLIKVLFEIRNIKHHHETKHELI